MKVKDTKSITLTPMGASARASRSYGPLRFFQPFTRRLAACAAVFGICVPIAQATPSIVEVRTAANNVIVVVVQTDVTDENGVNSVPDSLDTSPADWKVDGTSPANVYRYSIPWDELPAIGAGNVFPVTTRHKIYLPLSGTLQENHTYGITTPYGSTNWTFSSTSSFCESIKVNQVGYSGVGTSRFANFGVYMGNGGSIQYTTMPTYKVYNQNTGAILTNGTAVFMENQTDISQDKNSGEYVYRLSLDAVPDGGPYYVSVDGAGRSRSFGIGSLYSSNIAYVTMRGLYLHRCGIALTEPYTAFTHAICHTNIWDTRTANEDDDNSFNPSSYQTMYIQGGYHDAGDMDQSEAHVQIPILMLSFFEAFPNRTYDGQYNIPESGNGIPDLLDEAMWGVKGYEYLQITNPSDSQYGGVRDGRDGQGYTQYGVNDAANDTIDYGTEQVTEDCTAMAAGMFAQASRLIRPYDSAHADALLNRAELAWAYFGNHGISVTQIKTHFMYAALQLYLATGSSTYNSIFTNIASAVVLNDGRASWPESYDPGNGEATCHSAHFVSYLLPNNAQYADPAWAQALKNKILSWAQTGGYYGPPPQNLAYPQGATSFLEWGSGTAQGRYADLWMYACLFTNDPATLESYTNAVSQYADYSLGLNAMNMSYITGLGTDQPNSPLDCNSYFTKYGTNDGEALPGGTLDNHRDANGNPIGNVPGITVYGPTEGESGTYYQMAIWEKVVPAWTNLPPQRRYAQGWSLVNNNEFTVQETMVWEALMYSWLYMPTNGGIVNTNPPPPPSTTIAQPATGTITIDGNLSEPGWQITNAVTKLISGTDNNTVTFGAMWDYNYLYIGANVLDSTLVGGANYASAPWQGDALEVYIDGDDDHGTSYDTHDRQLVQGWDSSAVWGNSNQTNGVVSAWATIPGGYSVEMAIPWTNLGVTPSSGMNIGLDIANDDNDSGGTLRDGQTTWVGTANDWTDPSGFGSLTLTGNPASAPSSDEFTNDADTIALYHFDGNYNDSSGDGFNLTPYGNVSLTSTNLGWMQNPTGEAANFNNLGDELVITNIPDSVVEPGPNQTPLSIEARIYVRGYKAYNVANASLISLEESQNWDDQLQVYDPIYPGPGDPNGVPTVNGATTTIIVTGAQWQNAVSLNTWHKFKLTFAANGTASCYIDGNLINSVSTSVNVARTSPWALTLGNFDGLLDEVRISDVVR